MSNNTIYITLAVSLDKPNGEVESHDAYKAWAGVQQFLFYPVSDVLADNITQATGWRVEGMYLHSVHITEPKV